MYETVVPPLDERDFENTVSPILQEYFEHGDTNEVAVSVQETTRPKDRNTPTKHARWLTSLSLRPGAARRTEPGPHAERGALAGRVPGAGGQSQPPGADLQAAGGSVWAGAVPRRHGNLLRQTAAGAARSGPGHTGSPAGESPQRLQRSLLHFATYFMYGC